MGELYIERKEVSQILRKKVFFVEEGDYGKCYSLIGPNGIGKTTLIRHLSDELERAAKPHTYYFNTVLEAGTSFWQFWTVLILKFSDTIGEEELAMHLCQMTGWWRKSSNPISSLKKISGIRMTSSLR